MNDKTIKVTPYNLLDCLSTSALKVLLKQDLNGSEEELPMETLQYIIHLLEERNQELASARKSTDVDSAWAQFVDNSIPLAENAEELTSSLIECAAVPKETPFQGKSHAKRVPRFTIRYAIRKAGIIAATICILFTVMISVQASGIDVFGAMARWTDETFHFEVHSDYESNEDKGYATDKPAALLSAYSLDRELAPTWYPAGYTMGDIEIHQEDGNLQIFYSYENEEGNYFSVQVLKYENSNELSNYTIEKSNEDVEIFKSHGKQFYVLTNEDTITATWSDGHILETVSGNLSREDLFQIIKSIGGN